MTPSNTQQLAPYAVDAVFLSKLSNLNTHYTAKDYKTQKLGSYRQTQLDNLPVGKPQSRERRGDVFHSPTGV